MKSFTWSRLAVTTLAAGSTYFLRWALAPVSQALAYFVPVLLAAYLFGSVMATVAFGLTLIVLHAIIWTENPALMSSPQYMIGILNYTLFAALIILYTHRHEKVLRRLDESLAREKEARKEAEDANRLKDEFLATLSHELRTPINVILGYLQILLAERSKNPRRALEIVHRNAQQQARLIEDVLDVSRITTGNVQMSMMEVRPGAVLRDALESLQPTIVGKGLHLHLGPVDEDVVILADPDRLRQVFWNLLSNAIKFTPPGGNLSVRAAAADAVVEIVVQDSGRGIRKEFMPHVFDMFRQADPSPTRDVSGMGLGLNLVKQFVELQGGTVTAQSAGEGAGATFICRFPIYSAEPGEARAV